MRPRQLTAKLEFDIYFPRVFAQLELDFNCEFVSNCTTPRSNILAAIERIGEYLDVEQEASATSANRPPAYWPSSNGGIIVEVGA